ncbi:MAG: hypothetical protein KA452_06895, partial [Nitrospira sp.]|nr:hypothetical protein [Nitrospira sp.]
LSTSTNADTGGPGESEVGSILDPNDREIKERQAMHHGIADHPLFSSVDSHTLSPFWKTASKPTSPDYS